jgi:hypothetical protein
MWWSRSWWRIWPRTRWNMSLSSMWSPGASSAGCPLLDDKMSTMRRIDGQRLVIHMILKKNIRNNTNKIRKEVKKNMPRRDGTGPTGQGPGGGRGRGLRGGFGLGPGGHCRCTKCGYTEPHQLGIPCYDRKCPKCGSPMLRD